MKNPKLNIGCGSKILKGWINADFIKAEGVDLVLNLNKYPWPFNTNSIEEIYADNVLEHLDNFDMALKECHRILKKNGTVLIKVPYFSNPGAFNPSHKSYFSFYSLETYCSNVKQVMGLKIPLFEEVYKKITFLDEYRKSFLLKIYFFIPKLFYRINPKIYIWLFSYIFPASEIHFKLKKI